MMHFNAFGFLVRCELRRLWRRKDAGIHAFLFAGLLLLLFSFSFGNDESMGTSLQATQAAGFLWMVLLLTCTLATQHNLRIEQESNVHRILWLSPLPRPVIYLVKTLVLTFFLVWVMGIFVLLLLLFWHIQPISWIYFIALIFLGIFGLSSLSTLFASAMQSGKAAGWLPLLTYPLSIPLLLAGVQSSQNLLQGSMTDWESIRRWTQFLLVFDGLAFLVGLWLFEPLSSKE